MQLGEPFSRCLAAPAFPNFICHLLPPQKPLAHHTWSCSGLFSLHCNLLHTHTPPEPDCLAGQASFRNGTSNCVAGILSINLLHTSSLETPVLIFLRVLEAVPETPWIPEAFLKRPTVLGGKKKKGIKNTRPLLLSRVKNPTTLFCLGTGTTGNRTTGS